MDNANKHLPRRKRSVRLTLALMGAGAASTLAGCGDSSPETLSNVQFDDTESYRSVEDCVAGGIYTRKACEAAYDQALEDVPHYRTQSQCEEEHGEDACQTAPHTNSGSGSWFMPAMMGYMVGNMTASSSRGHMVNRVYQEPVYRTRDNQGDWSAATSSASSRMKGVESSMRTTIRTHNRAVRNSSYSTSRSGFGSRSSARGGFGS
ncbi:DUF1190 domain-containing protein [Halomonas organivorans]|uniref:Uncharacterized protein YgiB involved in biofilm formation n=1 Tax=Halomonas organivorans TaxID=257772 RepID=A0A7W5BUG6_9GAMM|nr:DUF1190 domain-containing protein [Halomonas organivorans]MBB3139372.1 uncharacterized protein YgiB involved in biofilm formation [Halomonas organivorans]